MDVSEPWQSKIIERFMTEVGRGIDFYSTVSASSTSHSLRWVTEAARNLAKQILQSWKDDFRSSANDEPVRTLLTDAVMSKNSKPIDWPSLMRHLSRAPHNSDTFGTVQLTVALIHAAANGIPSRYGVNGSITIRSLPPDVKRQAQELWHGSITGDTPLTSPRPASPMTVAVEPTPGAPSVASSRIVDWVQCPSPTADYRVVVVGELPQRGLHPVAFVNPGHQEGIWYAQEKPLVFKQGVAFCAYLNLGNPLGVGYPSTQSSQSEQPAPPFPTLDYFLKIYALEDPWDFSEPKLYRKAYEEDELESSLRGRHVKFCWPAADSWRPSDNPKKIQRDPPAIDSVYVSDAANPPKLLEIPAELNLVSPVTLSWSANEPSYVEVRKALDHDRYVEQLSVVPIAGRCRAILAIQPYVVRNPPTLSVLVLPERGFYRIKLFPKRPRRFLDPLHELWIHIEDGSRVG